MAENVGNLRLAAAGRCIKGADAEPRARRRGLADDDAGHEHVAGDFDHGADRTLGADDGGDVVDGHAVLQADDQTVGS